MKKILILSIFCNIFIFCFSQNNNEFIISELAEDAATKLAKNIYGKRKQITKQTKDSTKLTIYFNLLHNNNERISDFSEIMTKYVANKLENKLEEKLTKTLKYFESVDIFYEKNNFITNYDKNYDYDLKWEFIKTKDTLKFHNIKLIIVDDSDSSSISIDEFSIDYKTKIDDDYFKISEYNYLKKIVNLNFNAVQIKKANIMLKDKQNNDIYPQNSNGIFAYTNLDITKEYYFNIDLQDSTYLYILFYDFKEPEFIYIIYPFYQNENILLNPGNNEICKKSPIVFGDLKSDTTYLKLILSAEKINIDNFTQPFENKTDTELKVIDKSNGKLFLKYLNKERYNKKIQTQQFYLIF